MTPGALTASPGGVLPQLSGRWRSLPARLSGRSGEAPLTGALTTIISSSFVTMEHELPLEVISEDLRLVNKGT